MNKKHTTIVYIDGFNFYFGCLKGTSYKWLNIEALFDSLLSKQNTIVKINYFTARVRPSNKDPDIVNRQNAYLKAISLSCSKVECLYGHFLRNKVFLENVNPPPPVCRVWKNEEKGSDVNLAIHLLNDAWNNRFDVAVVVSNDSDLAEALRLVKQEHNKIIGLVTPGAPKRRTSQQLSQYADFILPVRKNSLASHQLPTQIPDSRISKPPNW